MALYQAPLEDNDSEIRVKAVALVVAAVASVIVAIAVVVVLMTQPWSDGWELEPRPGPGILAGNDEQSGPGQGR
jgi:hypothetical protein